MFSAPPAITAETYCVIPKHLWKTGGDRTEWSKVMFHGIPAATFLEGPAFDLQGNLWLVDIPWGRLFRISPAKEVSVAFEYDGWPNGMKFHPNGKAYVADHKHGIMVFDPATECIEPLVERSFLQSFKGVNDLVFASNGDLYFTDQGQTGHQDASGRLYRLRVNGQLDCVLDGIPSPNGLVLNKAENAVLLAVTRANAVWRVPLMSDGTASKVGTFIQMSGGLGPDGMAIDQHDNIAVCHAGLGTVWLFSAKGEPMLRINSITGNLTTNCAYGGDDWRSLFFTESSSGTVLSAILPVPGRPTFSHSVIATQTDV